MQQHCLHQRSHSRHYHQACNRQQPQHVSPHQLSDENTISTRLQHLLSSQLASAIRSLSFSSTENCRSDSQHSRNRQLQSWHPKKYAWQCPPRLPGIIKLKWRRLKVAISGLTPHQVQRCCRQLHHRPQLTTSTLKRAIASQDRIHRLRRIVRGCPTQHPPAKT